MRRPVFICLLLAGITLALYWPVRQYDLIYFDDPLIMTDAAPALQAGLTWPTVKGAFTIVVAANWHPVTNLSFLLVSQFFGIAPGPQHFANAVIHAANAALLFLLLWRLTGATWRSAAVAAIFAWHPLRVESVAWIIERKDVLCGFFFLLTLLAYAAHVQKQAKAPARKWTWYLVLALGAFALALLSKPMAVTLPFVLLLLDVWPLKRIAIDGWGALTKSKSLWLEKWLFFLLAIAFSVLTYCVQREASTMSQWDDLGLSARVANAISGYVAYPAKLLWPTDLAVLYPLTVQHDHIMIILKTALLATITCGCLMQLLRRPWLAFGWLWYLGTLVPVIGIVQAGVQSFADRYTYLPMIGPVIAIVWTIAEIVSPMRWGKSVLATATVLIISALAAVTEHQLGYWRNTVDLFEHTIAVTPENPAAMYTLGIGYEHTGETEHAIVAYREALMLAPGNDQCSRRLAGFLLAKGYVTAAEAEYRRLLAIEPKNSVSHMALAAIYANEGRVNDYIFELNQAVQSDPENFTALNNLAWELAANLDSEIRDGPRAVTMAKHACELTGYRKTLFVGTLAAAYAQAGRFDDAIATAQRACDLAQQNGEIVALQRNQELLTRYQAHLTAN